MALSKLLPIPFYLLISGTLSAQENSSAQESDLALERIEVTAQKRVTGLQEVPISMTAMSGEKIQEAGIPELADLSAYIPNFAVTQNAIGDVVSIRGVQSGVLASIEQSVGTFVDGVYRGRGVQTRFAFLDVAMVEVLRGPQSTLFGKNTIGGALNISSAQPTEDFDAMLSAQYEFEHQERELQGHVSGALSEQLNGRFAAMYRQMDEGWMENRYYQQHEPMADEWAARGILDWQLNDQLSVTLKLEHGEWDNDGMPYADFKISDGLAFSFDLFGVPGETLTSDRQTSIGNNSAGIDYGSSQHFVGDSDELVLQLDYRLNNGVVTAIYGGSRYQFNRDLDADFNAFDAIGFEEFEDFQQDSLEIRFVSDTEGRFDYIVGWYYQTAELVANAKSNFNVDPADPDSLAGPASLVAFSELAPLGALPDLDGDGVLTPNDGRLLVGSIGRFTRAAELTQDTDSWALFGQGIYDLSDNLTLTLGLRYGEEDKSAIQQVQCAEWDSFNIIPADICTTTNPLGLVLAEFTPHRFTDLAREEEDWNYQVALQWQLSAQTMLYANSANGSKSGGFNSFALSASLQEAEFEEEGVTSVELGGKFSLASGAAELNIALYSMDYEDLQASIFTGATGFKVENATSASLWGIEIDGRWRATENFTIRGALGYSDFEYDDYPNAACTDAQKTGLHDGTFAWGTFIKPAPGTRHNGATAVDLDGDGLTETCEQVLTGQSNAFTPEFSGSLSFEHEMDLSEALYLRSVFDVNYRDEHATAQDLDPIPFQDAYTLLNFSITLSNASNSWELSLLGRNISNEQYITYSNDMPLFAGSQQVAWGRGANYSLRAKFKFY